MEILALLSAWAFALTFVAFTGKSKKKIPKAAVVRVPSRLPRNSGFRHMKRYR